MKTNMQLQVFFICCVCLLSDANITLKVINGASDGEQFVCSSEVILMCKIQPVPVAMTWTIGDDPIADCTATQCARYASTPSNYAFTTGDSGETYNLTINPVTFTENNETFRCDDGSTQKSVDAAVIVLPDNSTTSIAISSGTELTATTGCVYPHEIIAFNWYYYNDNTSPTPYTGTQTNESITCMSNTNCGGNETATVTNTLTIKEDSSGDDYYFQVVVKHDNAPDYVVAIDFIDRTYKLKVSDTTNGNGLPCWLIILLIILGIVIGIVIIIICCCMKNEYCLFFWKENTYCLCCMTNACCCCCKMNNGNRIKPICNCAGTKIQKDIENQGSKKEETKHKNDPASTPNSEKISEVQTEKIPIAKNNRRLPDTPKQKANTLTPVETNKKNIRKKKPKKKKEKDDVQESPSGNKANDDGGTKLNNQATSTPESDQKREQPQQSHVDSRDKDSGKEERTSNNAQSTLTSDKKRGEQSRSLGNSDDNDDKDSGKETKINNNEQCTPTSDTKRGGQSKSHEDNEDKDDGNETNTSNNTQYTSLSETGRGLRSNSHEYSEDKNSGKGVQSKNHDNNEAKYIGKEIENKHNAHTTP